MMCSKIVCTDKIPTDPSKLFFGDSGKLLRVDRVDFPVLNNLFKTGFSNVWSWTAIDFLSDILGWNTLDPVAQRIFLLNNGYQTLMDSGVVGIYNLLAQLATNTELALNYQYIAQNESIHAGSYSYGLSQMFGSEAYNKINIVYEDKFIQKRMESEIDFSTELFQKVVVGAKCDNEAKSIIFKAIVAAYALEHIKFPFSFFATWTLNKNYNNALQGFSMLLKLIAQDELDYHVPVNANVLKILKRDKNQMFQDVWDENFIVEYIKQVTEAELEWSGYLLKDGELPGFSTAVNKAFILYHADKTLKDLGLEPIYGAEKTDSIEWYNSYRRIKNQNSALQEVSNNSYKKGIIKNDILSNLDKLKKIVQ